MQTNQTAPTNPLNEPKKNYSQGKNTFPLSYDHATTMSYGYLTPHFVFNSVEGDTVPLNSKHRLMSPTLKSPVFSKVLMNKDYFSVPMRAILPKTWELIYANPVQGDDVPWDANCVVRMDNLIPCLIQPLILPSMSTAIDNVKKLQMIIKMVLILESVFSYGGLPTRLGYNLASGLRISTGNGLLGDSYSNTNTYGKMLSFDEWFELYFVPFLKHYAPKISVDDKYIFVLDESGERKEANVVPVDTRGMLEIMRNNPDWFIVSSDVITSQENMWLAQNVLINKSAWCYSNGNSVDSDEEASVFNLDRIIAYQLACSQYFTNEKVDYVFTSKMYQEMMRTLAAGCLSPISNQSVNTSAIKFFEYNGNLIQYDVFSGNTLALIFHKLNGSYWIHDGSTSVTESTQYINYIFGFFMNLFGLRQSLRFGDYFTGARVEPLAVGDVTAQVADSSVSAIDVTKSILMQRFLNAVNRTGQRFKDYIKMMSGVNIGPDSDEPRYLAHSSSVVGGMEIENTAEDQGNIVTVLRSSDSNYEFTADISEPGIVLGITSFAIKRLYCLASDKFFFKKDRFDMFNKFMQYSGDQAITNHEVNLLSDWLYGTDEAESAFAYTGRYMEYKQRNSIATGAFVNFLPSWLFVADNAFGLSVKSENDGLSPMYIRANSTEFDRFLNSSYYSLAGHFHFIVYVSNECNASRAMDYNPSIL